jgi:hypothetical protein
MVVFLQEVGDEVQAPANPSGSRSWHRLCRLEIAWIDQA